MALFHGHRTLTGRHVRAAAKTLGLHREERSGVFVSGPHEALCFVPYKETVQMSCRLAVTPFLIAWN